MNKIQNYEAVIALEKQLEADLIIKRELVFNDIAQLQDEFRPIANLVSGLGKFNYAVKNHPLLSIGLGLAAGVLEKNILATGDGWIARLIMPLVTKGLISGGSSVLGKFLAKWKG